MPRLINLAHETIGAFVAAHPGLNITVGTTLYARYLLEPMMLLWASN